MDRVIVAVSGDIVRDHHLYEGKRPSPAFSGEQGVLVVEEWGGAALIERMLIAIKAEAEIKAETEFKRAQDQYKADFENGMTAAIPERKSPVELNTDILFGVKKPACGHGSCGSHAYALWGPHSDESSKKIYWRAACMMGFGHDRVSAKAPACEQHAAKCSIEPAGSLQPANIVVLDEGGFLFRDKAAENSWKPLLKSQPEWVVLKMSAPIAHGELWAELMKHHAKNLICMVSTNDIRKDCVGINKGLSWERTLSDIKSELGTNPSMSPLRNCRHLIVTFGSDGALWLDQTGENTKAVFVGDMSRSEGEFEDDLKTRALGRSSCMISAITLGLIRHKLTGKEDISVDLSPHIAAGINAMRNLAFDGHGVLGEDLPDGFPVKRLARVILDNNGPIARLAIPWNSDTTDANWMIAESSQRRLDSQVKRSVIGLARQVVLQGESAIKALPHATFGKMLTADRAEIEALRNIRGLMLQHRSAERANKPLSIGVFGPPGAGKSFGVRQLADGVFGADSWLEFNLSQFRDATDLIGAFHQVRDKVLGGVTPVVFWDEFDSREYYWLQYLIAPMQDGRFQEGQLNHAVGKCVFVFAGGTSFTYDSFGPHDDNVKAVENFKLSKGPDFKSRLDVFYNVLGPNRRSLSPTNQTGAYKPKGQGASTAAAGDPLLDPSDICWPLRRAILIRAQLGFAKSDSRLDFDPGLLDALLRIPKYEHGARSLEKLVAALRPSTGISIRRSSLPSPSNIAIHVDYAEFQSHLDADTGFIQDDVIEPLAEEIHEFYRKLTKQNNWPVHPRFDMPYKDLGEVEKDENRAAARRIPQVIALAGMGLAKGAGSNNALGEAVVKDQIEFHIERLAEAEHDGWMAYRMHNGWTLAEIRDDNNGKHNALTSYERLNEQTKEKDRDAVRHYPEIVSKVKYHIVFLDEA